MANRFVISDKFVRTKPTILLTGVVMVALGIAVLVNPIGALEVIIRIMGWILVAYALITIVPLVMQGKPIQSVLTDVWFAGVAGIVGLIMGIFPNFMLTFVWTLIGIMVLATGLLDIMEAKNYRRDRSPLATPATASGAICAALGALVIFMPLLSPTMAMLVGAIALIVNGVTEIIFGLGM